MNNSLCLHHERTRVLPWSKRILLIFSALLLLMLHGTSFAQDANVQMSNWLLGVLFKLNHMRDGAVADIQKYERDIQKSENTIRKSEDILRRAQEAGNANAENIARQALTKAQEAKKANESNYYLAKKKLENIKSSTATVESILRNQLGVKAGNEDSNTSHDKKQEVTLAPYFEEGVPPVNCADALNNLNNRNCYCPSPNRPPVCTKDGERLKENDKMYMFYWMIEIVSPRGIIRNDGTHFGTYKSYDEAYAGCMEDAKNSSLDIEERVAGAVVLSMRCTPQ